MKHNYLLLLLFCIFSSVAIAQNDSIQIHTIVKPGDSYRVKINGELQPPTNKFKVRPGRYQISIWAPGYEVFDTTAVFTQEYSRVIKVLTPTPELNEYLMNAQIYSTYRRRAILSGTVAGIIGGVAIFNYGRIGTLNLEQIQEENGVKYDIDGHTQSTLDAADASLRNAKVFQYALIGGASMAGCYTIWNIYKMKKQGKPKLNDKSFLVDGVGMVALPNGNMGVAAKIRF